MERSRLALSHVFFVSKDLLGPEFYKLCLFAFLEKGLCNLLRIYIGCSLNERIDYTVYSCNIYNEII